MMPTLTAAMNSLPGGVVQRPHRHNSVAVSLVIKGDQCFSVIDGKRKDWKVSGPFFAGWEIYHMKGSPADPNRIYASQTSGWFGQIIQRSDDGGATWNPPGTKLEDIMGADGFPKGKSNDFAYEGEVGTHKFYDGSQHPWEFKRIWHIEPSLTDPDTAYAGAEDAALFKTTDGGKTWKELSNLRKAKGHLWQPGAGGMGLHTIVQDPTNPQRMYIAISAAGVFRTEDGGTTWTSVTSDKYSWNFSFDTRFGALRSST